jgi:predicted  nucleic acid-binding Zn-ribbon protein
MTRCKLIPVTPPMKLKCQNCGEEFNGNSGEEICPSCFENFMREQEKEFQAQQWADFQWHEYHDEEERKAEERAEHSRAEWLREQERKEEEQAERNRKKWEEDNE